MVLFVEMQRYNNTNSSNYRRSGHRRNHFKQNLMRNANAYVEHLFEVRVDDAFIFSNSKIFRKRLSFDFICLPVCE